MRCHELAWHLLRRSHPIVLKLRLHAGHRVSIFSWSRVAVHLLLHLVHLLQLHHVLLVHDHSDAEVGLLVQLG